MKSVKYFVFFAAISALSLFLNPMIISANPAADDEAPAFALKTGQEKEYRLQN